MRWVPVLLVAGLVGCNEATAPAFGGSGEDITSDPHYDSGDSGGGDTAGVPGGPMITSVALAFVDYGQVGVIIEGRLTYTDDPDDVVGDSGKLFFKMAEDSGSATQYTLSVVSAADLDASKQQAYQDPDSLELIFGIADVDTEKDYSFTEIILKDNSGNESPAEDGTVAAGSYTGA